jgi:hypothetical protein
VRLLAGLAVLSSLSIVPCEALGWSSFKVGSYTLDLSVESEHEAHARLTLEIEVQGGRFRGFKIARGDEGLSWSSKTMFCENSSGKRYVLRRVPRADGLTDFRFVTPGYIPRGSAICSMEYSFDPVELGTIAIVGALDPEAEDGAERVRFTYKSPGLPLAVESFTITLHLPGDVSEDVREIGEFAAEEYTVEHFASAMTMRRFRPPPYYTGLVDVTLPHDVLIDSDAGDGGTAGYAMVHVDRFVGIPHDGRGPAGHDLWMFTVLAVLALALLAAKHWGTRAADALAGVDHPYLLFPATSAFARFWVSAALLVLYVVLAGSSRDSSALVCLAVALVANLRSGLTLGAATAGDPGQWTEVHVREAQRRLRGAGRRESSARLFLDATTLPGLALLASAVAGLAALVTYILVDEPATAVPLAAGASVVLSFTFLTSTGLGGYGHLARRTLRRLRAALSEYARLGEDGPALCLREDPARGTFPEMRLRRLVPAEKPFEDGVMEVGVEWRRGWCVWRPSYAVVVRLDARAGALVADEPWLERAEVHTRLEEGRTAIVVRGPDPWLPFIIEERIRETLGSAAPTSSVEEVARQLGRDGDPERDGLERVAP